MKALATLRLAALALLLTATSAMAQTQVRVTADITSNTTWSNSNEYLLDGLIFVDGGATLTIEAGTVVRGVLNTDITTGDGAAALVVRKAPSSWPSARPSSPSSSPPPRTTSPTRTT